MKRAGKEKSSGHKKLKRTWNGEKWREREQSKTEHGE